MACANELRHLGYAGAITMLSADGDPPCDRPNLSKDYLAGNAPEEWIPLRSDDWYRDRSIELRLETRVRAIDVQERSVELESGERVGFDRLGQPEGTWTPNRPPLVLRPAFPRPDVPAGGSPAAAAGSAA